MSIQSSIVGAVSSVADTVKGISDIKASQENQAQELNKQSLEERNKLLSNQEQVLKAMNEIHKLNKEKPQFDGTIHYDYLDKKTSAENKLTEALSERRMSYNMINTLKNNLNRLKWAKDTTTFGKKVLDEKLQPAVTLDIMKKSQNEISRKDLLTRGLK